MISSDTSEQFSLKDSITYLRFWAYERYHALIRLNNMKLNVLCTCSNNLHKVYYQLMQASIIIIYIRVVITDRWSPTDHSYSSMFYKSDHEHALWTIPTYSNQTSRFTLFWNSKSLSIFYLLSWFDRLCSNCYSCILK